MHVATAKNSSPPPMILIVEDNAPDREYLQAVLEPDHEVIAVDGSRALWDVLALLNEDVAAMLMDIRLPGQEDGLVVTRKLRAGAAGERWKHVPIVAITALSDVRRDALHAGCDAYFAKPASPSTVRTIVARVLEATRAIQAQEEVDARRSRCAESSAVYLFEPATAR